jgi:hypothetical protein
MRGKQALPKRAANSATSRYEVPSAIYGFLGRFWEDFGKINQDRPI